MMKVVLALCARNRYLITIRGYWEQVNYMYDYMFLLLDINYPQGKVTNINVWYQESLLYTYETGIDWYHLQLHSTRAPISAREYSLLSDLGRQT